MRQFSTDNKKSGFFDFLKNSGLKEEEEPVIKFEDVHEGLQADQKVVEEAIIEEKPVEVVEEIPPTP